jgi:hypothetical protein
MNKLEAEVKAKRHPATVRPEGQGTTSLLHYSVTAQRIPSMMQVTPDWFSLREQ